MGSKGLKWVVVDPGAGKPRSPPTRRVSTRSSRTTPRATVDGPQIFRYGTSAILPTANLLNTLPYKNRTAGQSPDAANLAGRRSSPASRPAAARMHNCMTGCIVQCSNVVHDADGQYLTSALEFETLALLGSNCAVTSWEDVADLDRLCDEIGVDTIEAGAAIAVLMDAGQMEWGDVPAMKKMLEQMGEGTDLGKTVGDGAASVGKSFNHERVPVVKGQAVPAWDPRPLKATGVTYATSPMGADHTAGLVDQPRHAAGPVRAGLTRVTARERGLRLVRLLPVPPAEHQQHPRVLQPPLRRDVTAEQIADIGWQCLQDEWEFNAARASRRRTTICRRACAKKASARAAS